MWVFARTLPRECVLVAPRRPESIVRPSGGADDAADFDGAVVALRRFVSGLVDIYGISPERLGWLGFSQGAAVAFAAAAAGVPACAVAALVGFLPHFASPPDAFRGLPVFWAAGVRDPHVPIARARADGQVLKRFGARLEFHEYPVRHQVNSAGFADLADWWRRSPLGS
jgi:phospholipase/carboxylesterase